MSTGFDRVRLKRLREYSAPLCVPVKRPSTASTEDEQQRVHLGSIRVDFQDTHQRWCTKESRMFCYARCDTLKKMISKMLNGTSAIAITMDRVLSDPVDRLGDHDDDDAADELDGQSFVVKCNGVSIGSFGGASAALLAGALDARELDLVGGNKAPSWSEADFDVFHRGQLDDAAARKWKRKLSAVDGSFEPDVWAKERVCSSGSCDCC